MTINGYFHRVNRMTPTRMWVNNVTVEQARLGLAAGATGCTQNPSFVDKMFAVQPDESRGIALQIMSEHADDTESLIRIQAEMVGRIAKEFLPLYEETHGRLGYVTIQGDPFRENTPTILRQAEIARTHGLNVMPKVPVVPAAMEGIGALVGEGIPVCVTEVFALRQAVEVCECVVKATRGKVRPVVMLAHIAGIYDEFLGNYVKANDIDISPDVLWHAGIAVAKKIYEVVRERRYPVEFLGGGARGLHHFTEMVGAEGSVTINWGGTADKLEGENPLVVQRFLMPTPATVVDELLEKLPDFRRGWFMDAIEPSEYESFGPVALFRNTFERSWVKAVETIATLRKS